MMAFYRKTKHNICSFVKEKRKNNKCQCLWVVEINFNFILRVLEIPLIFPFIMLELEKLFKIIK